MIPKSLKYILHNVIYSKDQLAKISFRSRKPVQKGYLNAMQETTPPICSKGIVCTECF